MISKMPSNLTLICNRLGINNLETDDTRIENNTLAKPCICGHNKHEHLGAGRKNCDWDYCECEYYVPANKNNEVKP